MENTQGHVLFGSALKRSSRGIGCSRSDVRSTAGRTQGKPTGGPLQERDGRCTAFLALPSLRFYTHKQRRQNEASENKK